MTLRFCPRCRADVEDAGGYCLLGHTFPDATPDPIADLRAEVDKAFAKVQVEVAHSLDQHPVAAPEKPVTVPVYEQLKSDDAELVEEMHSTRRDLWEQLRGDAPVSKNDPIIAFSPSPRAEWGPERTRRRRARD